jgi:regulatory protein
MSRAKKPQSLREQALACLARREHSRAELTRKLGQAGHPPEEIPPLLDEFESKNWLSDRRFAESYVADHRARSGPVKLAYELRLRGLDEHLIEAVLAETRASELERAREIWRKKFGARPIDSQGKARQMRFLQSRGFNSATIRKIVEREEN